MVWGNLPIICSGGDPISRYIKDFNAGIVLESNDPEELTNAVVNLLANKEDRLKMRKNLEKLSEKELNWDHVIKPLDDFCKNPKIDETKIDKGNPAKNLKYHYGPIKELKRLVMHGVRHWREK